MEQKNARSQARPQTNEKLHGDEVELGKIMQTAKVNINTT